MATLQKIRNQGGIWVSIIIGIALLAFIIDPSILGSFSGNRNNVGEIDGEKVSIQDFSKRLNNEEELIKSMQGISSFTEEQSRQLNNQVWQQMIQENLLTKEYKAVGIGVGEDEMFDLVLGDHMDPVMTQLFGDPSTGVVDRAYVQTVIQQIVSLPNSDPQKQYWLKIERQIHDQNLLSKYAQLISKGLYVTSTDLQIGIENSGKKADISLLRKSYNTISDSTIEVTSDEIRTYYKNHQYLFNQEESRQIGYVMFEQAASLDDKEDTRAAVEKMIPEFEDSTSPEDFARLATDGDAESYFMSKPEVKNEELADWLFGKKAKGVFGPYAEGEDQYCIARIVDRQMLPDSVRARHILLQPADGNIASSQHIADSLVNLLKKGKADFEQLASTYSADQASSVNGGDLGWFAQNAMVKPFSDAVFSAKLKEYGTVQTAYGIHIYQVTRRSALVEKVKAAIVVKDVIPSQATINTIYNEARTFITDVTTKAEFDQAVSDHNVVRRLANLNRGSYTIPGLESPRELIRQAMTAEKAGVVLTTGDEDPIFEIGNYYVVAVLNSIQEEGLAPVEQVASSIRRQLVNEKKADQIVADMNKAAQGSESLLSTAQKMGETTQDITDVAFSSMQIGAIGIEPKVIAAVASLEEGEISAPIEGNQGVYMVMVNHIEPAVMPEASVLEQNKKYADQSNYYRVSQQMIPALEKAKNVQDYRYRFY